ncbi:MAG: hypothetical protein AAFX99_32335, partial [Myxococcota bacterium]
MVEPGHVIGARYRVLEPLGKGGMGTTYAAEDIKTGQQVALKALSLESLSDWKALELFEREARVLKSIVLSATHIIDVGRNPRVVD